MDAQQVLITNQSKLSDKRSCSSYLGNVKSHSKPLLTVIAAGKTPAEVWCKADSCFQAEWVPYIDDDLTNWESQSIFVKKNPQGESWRKNGRNKTTDAQQKLQMGERASRSTILQHQQPTIWEHRPTKSSPCPILDKAQHNYLATPFHR